MLLRDSRKSRWLKHRFLTALITVSCVEIVPTYAQESDEAKETPAIQIKLTKTEKEKQTATLNEEIAELLELDPSSNDKTSSTQKVDSKPGQENSSKPASQTEQSKTKRDKSAPQRDQEALTGSVKIELTKPTAVKSATEETALESKTNQLPVTSVMGGDTSSSSGSSAGVPTTEGSSTPELSTPALRKLALPAASNAGGGQRQQSVPQAESKTGTSPEETPQKAKTVEAPTERKTIEPAGLPSDPQITLGTKLKDEKGESCPGDPGNASPDGAKLPSEPDDLPVEDSRGQNDIDAPIATEQQSKQSVQLTDQADDGPAFTERELAVERKIIACLDYFRTHPENTTRRGPWALMHATLPFGVETEIIAGNRRVNAIGWMCYNGVCAKQRVFQPTRHGFRLHVGPGVQGHEGQFLAILAQSQVSPSYPIQIGRSRYTVADLVKHEMATCRERSELTFKLIGFSHYLSPDQRWRDQRGRTWNLEKMVAEELAQPINGAACGGTHRLMGLSFALIKRQEAGMPFTGHWKRAETFINDFVDYTMTLQNPDGSFSTKWFEGRGFANDTKRKVQTTGHIAEWLIYKLPDQYLRSPEMLAAIEYLLAAVGDNPEYDWPIGPRGHALRAMVLYKQRVFDAATAPSVASSEASVLR